MAKLQSEVKRGRNHPLPETISDGSLSAEFTDDVDCCGPDPILSKSPVVIRLWDALAADMFFECSRIQNHLSLDRRFYFPDFLTRFKKT